MIEGKIVYSNAWSIGDARICWYIRSNGAMATYEVWQQDELGEDYYCIYDGEDYTTAELHWDRAIDYARAELIRKYNKILNKASIEVEQKLPSWQR